MKLPEDVKIEDVREYKKLMPDVSIRDIIHYIQLFGIKNLTNN